MIWSDLSIETFFWADDFTANLPVPSLLHVAVDPPLRCQNSAPRSMFGGFFGSTNSTFLEDSGSLP